MKYAKKMMVVPYVEPTLEQPMQKNVSSLDTKMSDILKNSELSIDQK